MLYMLIEMDGEEAMTANDKWQAQDTFNHPSLCTAIL